MPARASNGQGRVIAHDLGTNHREGFTLSRIDFTWHDGRAWLIFWNQNLTNPTARARGEQTNIISNFHQRYRKLLECAVRLNERIVRGK